MNDNILENLEPSPNDSALNLHEANQPRILKVYQTGELTVVGFGGKDVPDEVCIANYRDQLFKLIDDHHCQVLAFDLTGVTLIPSGMLGLLTSLRKKVGRIELYNPSPDVREVLQMTRLDQFFDIKEVAID